MGGLSFSQEITAEGRCLTGNGVGPRGWGPDWGQKTQVAMLRTAKLRELIPRVNRGSRGQNEKLRNDCKENRRGRKEQGPRNRKKPAPWMKNLDAAGPNRAEEKEIKRGEKKSSQDRSPKGRREW